MFWEFLKIRFGYRSNSSHYFVSKILDYCIDSGLSEITKVGIFRATIKFKNGYQLEFWNTNLYYAWMSSGKLTSPEGEEYLWDNAMPSRRVCWKMFKALSKFDYFNKNTQK